MQHSLKLVWKHYIGSTTITNLTDRLKGKGKEGMKRGRRMVENWFSSGRINQIDHKKGIISTMN